MDQPTDQQRPPDAINPRMAEPRASAFRSRSPAELADQLDRNIKSLELTGSHLESAKDQPFYNAVAADMREAAAFLRQWEAGQRARESGRKIDRAIARDGGLRDAMTTAAMLRDAIGEAATDRAAGWRTAATAIAAGIEAQLAAHGFLAGAEGGVVEQATKLGLVRT